MNNFTHKLYLLTEDNPYYLALLDQLTLPDIEITSDKEQATILLASPPLVAKCFDEFLNVEWVQSIYAGVDALVPHLENFSGELTNVKGIFGQQISEYVLGYTIEHYRHFTHYHQQQTQKAWSPKPYQSLAGKKMVILGTGSIGAYLANAAKAFAIVPIGINRSGIPSKGSPFESTYHIQELATALDQADIVVNTLPNTPETQHILNSDSLSHCKGALLFNIGRGSALEQQGLLEALESESISHAFLDVFEQEPLESNHPYWQHPNITITPHIAALSFPEQVVEVFAENYQRWRDGFGLINTVDLDKGY